MGITITPVGTPLLNDATAGGAFSGSRPETIDVEIDGAGAPDTFRWRKDGGVWTSSVAITGTDQTLADGITIRFGATTGHKKFMLGGGPVGTPMLNDFNLGTDWPYGAYTGSVGAAYDVQIDGGDPTSPNTFKWRKDAGSWTSGVAINAGFYQVLSDQVAIGFLADTGHANGDSWAAVVTLSPDAWTITASPSASSQDPGLRQRLYLAGVSLLYPAESIQEVSQRAETAERMADTFTVIDRPYVFPGAPDAVTKYSWQLSIPRIGAPDYRTFARAEALADFFDFTMWKPISEIFSGDASRTVFYLLRRNALTECTVLPPNAASIYAVKTFIDGAPVSNPTFGSPDSRGVTSITFSSAPDAGASNIEVFYAPLFKVRIDQPTRDFPVTHRETRKLTLVEI